MKTARRFYVTSRDIEPDMMDCTYTVSGTRAVASFPAVVRLRVIVDDLDDKRAALKLEGSPREFFDLALHLIDVATGAAHGTDAIPMRRDLIDNFIASARMNLKAKA